MFTKSRHKILYLKMMRANEFHVHTRVDEQDGEAGECSGTIHRCDKHQQSGKVQVTKMSQKVES
jgi:hypothetical protein